MLLPSLFVNVSVIVFGIANAIVVVSVIAMVIVLVRIIVRVIVLGRALVRVLVFVAGTGSVSIAPVIVMVVAIC